MLKSIVDALKDLVTEGTLDCSKMGITMQVSETRTRLPLDTSSFVSSLLDVHQPSEQFLKILKSELTCAKT